jgi:hypothetical protein
VLFMYSTVVCSWRANWVYQCPFEKTWQRHDDDSDAHRYRFASRGVSIMSPPSPPTKQPMGLFGSIFF